MDKRLKNLFEYQKFERNGKLESIIGDTLGRYSMEELDDDSLENVAGGVKNDKPNISGTDL